MIKETDCKPWPHVCIGPPHRADIDFKTSYGKGFPLGGGFRVICLQHGWGYFGWVGTLHVVDFDWVQVCAEGYGMVGMVSRHSPRDGG